MGERKQVKVVVFDGKQYDGDWPTPDFPTTLRATIEWFQRKLEQIPPEYRDAARCEIESSGGYEGSHYGRITIEYYRAETDDEMDARITKERAALQALQEKEKAALRALRNKYPEA